MSTPTYKTIHEKYEAVSKTARPQRGVSWYMNPSMDASLPEGNFTLVQIPDDQYKRKESLEDGSGQSPWQLQGYVKYTPQAKVEPPVEARRAGRPPSEPEK